MVGAATYNSRSSINFGPQKLYDSLKGETEREIERDLSSSHACIRSENWAKLPHFLVSTFLFLCLYLLNMVYMVT